MVKAIFLDRDGVINYDHGYIYKVSDFKFVKGVFEALKKFQELGFLLFVVTNQSGIGRGYYLESDFLKLNDFMLKEFSKNNINISKVYYCPHSPKEGCECRKPKNKLLLECRESFKIDFSKSYFIGDKQSDIDCANSVSMKSFLVKKDCDDELEKVFEEIINVE